jgi:hypothetical protein
MSNGKHRLGLIGLCLTAAFALTAFVGASGAQAAGCTAANPTLKPCWMVSGNVTSELKVELGIEIEALGEKKRKTRRALIDGAGCADQNLMRSG